MLVDCQECAACCHAREGTILVSAASIVRWRRAGREDLVHTLTPGHFSEQALPMGSRGACVHLGLPGRDKSCSIYEIRPDTCRDYEAGSRQCQEARRERGLPAIVPLASSAP